MEAEGPHLHGALAVGLKGTLPTRPELEPPGRASGPDGAAPLPLVRSTLLDLSGVWGTFVLLACCPHFTR